MNSVLAEKTLLTGQTLQIIQGDITIDEVDAIVNAANEHLQHGGGVAWAIVRRGGDVIQEESDKWIQQHGLVSHAHPAWTSGGALPAKYIIHAVGPVWGDGGEDDKLADAIIGSLAVADELKCESVAIPAISTGIFGFPKDRAAEIIFKSIEKYFVEAKNSTVQIIRLVLFDNATIQVFLDVWGSTNSSFIIHHS